MQREIGIALMKRALDIMEAQRPEMAESHMEVPLDFYNDEAVAEKERELFETSPLALVASSEIPEPHDYLVRSAVGRSVLLTRDADGEAHAFLTYCRHRGAVPVQARVGPETKLLRVRPLLLEHQGLAVDHDGALAVVDVFPIDVLGFVVRVSVHVEERRSVSFPL